MSFLDELKHQQRQVLLGAIIAGSLFLIEAGVIEIILGLDLECRRAVGSLRLAPDPFSACMPEWQWLFLHSASRGLPWLLNSTTPAVVGALSMGVFYSITGGIIASLFKGKGVFIYLGFHLFLIALVAGLSYVGRYIA
jgi:hypothetical protein